MSYVSIWKPVNDRIVQVSRDSDNEVIGLLLGRLEDDTLVIEDTISGQFQGEPHRVTLPANTLAKIADDILNRRVKGNIIGWYHSHTESGLAFSETDVETQKNLQQFSPLITALVVDAKTGAVGCFRVNPETGQPTRIPETNITISEEPHEAKQPAMQAEPETNHDSSLEGPLPTTISKVWPSTKTIIYFVILAVAAGLIVMSLVLFRSLSGPRAAGILHNQILWLTVR